MIEDRIMEHINKTEGLELDVFLLEEVKKYLTDAILDALK